MGSGGHQIKPIILDPSDPMASARKMVGMHLSNPEGLRILHHYRGRFYLFTGSSYCAAQDGEVRNAIWKFLENAKRNASILNQGRATGTRVVSFKPSLTTVNNVAAALASVCEVPDELELPAWLPSFKGPGSDLPPHEFLAVPNGLLHVPSGELYSMTPAYFGLNASEVEFDPCAEAPTWGRFLQDLFVNDAESVDTIMEWFGYVLTPDTSFQKGMFFIGPPRAGKGIISRTLRLLVGAKNVCSPTLSSFQGEFGLQPLIGKLLATINDARFSKRADPATVAERLLSITGQDPISANRKNLSFWEGQLTTRFMILSNELPHFTDSSVALIKRFIVVQFTESWLGKEDATLEKRIHHELPGILNWAMAGYRRLHKRGHFHQPASAADAIQAMEDLASPIRAFVRDCCLIGPDHKEGVRVLFERWEMWCDSQGQRYPGTVQQFGRQLRAAFPHIRMEQHPRRYVGVAVDTARLRAKAEEAAKNRPPGWKSFHGTQ